MQIDISKTKKLCTCPKCALLEMRIKALEARFSQPTDETAAVLNRRAKFQNLKNGMRYFISVEGLIQSLGCIEKQENNIITLKEGIEIDFLTIHIF